MDADQWPLGVDVLKEQVKASQLIHDEQAGVERKARARARPEKEDALNCPRCNSTNTKFCYYNNYSLSQPRYFCKTCRRYWTEGGTTRNVPVGGGSRKNKPRSASICTLISSSSSSSPSSNSLLKRKLPLDPMTTFQNPRMILGVLEDLNLGSNYNSSSNHHPQLKNEHHVYYNSTSCGPAGAGAGALIPMFFGEGKSVDEFDQSPPANLSSSICHFMPPAAAGNSSIGFSFVGSTIAGTNNIINANNINVDHHHQYFKLQSLHEGGHGLIINDHHHQHIGNYGNDVAAAARTIQQGVFHETTSKRLISHHPHEEEPFTTSVLLLQAAADHRYQGQNNKGQLGESSGYSWGGGVSGRGGLW